MKKIFLFLLGFTGLMLFNSCKKDLNVKPVDQYSDASVWSDPALAQTFVNNIYGGVPHGFSNVMMSSICDESVYNANGGDWDVVKSLITPSNLNLFSHDWWTSQGTRLRSWGLTYKYVRACNIFFEKIDGVPFTDSAAKHRLEGEVHFLRAYLYFDLMELFGGVPIITTSYGIDDSTTIARNTFEETINFITSECDQAATLLSLDPVNLDNAADKGRATKGAALALKARTLLYAASDFYNSNVSWAPGYGHPELVGYVGGDRNARWQAAKDACKAVMDLGIYSLFGSLTPATAEEASTNYTNIFLSQNTSEDIFVRYFTTKVDEGWDGYNPGLYNQPNGYHCWGSNCPIGQMVDAYEMADGTAFSWGNPAEAADPYSNRDPRFYSSINYNGAPWRQRPSDAASVEPTNHIQTGNYQKWDASQGKMVTVAGVDTRQSAFENWNGTHTGYYMRKFMDPTVDAQNYKQTVPWRYIRYSEIILDYAEACIGLHQEDEAKTYINMIRARAKMPPITSTGQQLINDYRNERRVELAFEDHRFYDIRRWMIAEVAYANDAKSAFALYPMLPDHTTSTHPTYSIGVAQPRAWNPRFYMLPIALDEINRNGLLIQNPLY
jgi:hypothetical protein